MIVGMCDEGPKLCEEHWMLLYIEDSNIITYDDNDVYQHLGVWLEVAVLETKHPTTPGRWK